MEVKIHTIIQNDNLYLTCEYSPSAPYLLVIHCEMYKWSHSLYKEYTILWEDIVRGMAKQGVTQLGIVVPNDNIKLMRFATMFGFEVEADTYYKNSPATLFLMEIGE